MFRVAFLVSAQLAPNIDHKFNQTTVTPYV